jgi:hypothetical protein
VVRSWLRGSREDGGSGFSSGRVRLSGPEARPAPPGGPDLCVSTATGGPVATSYALGTCAPSGARTGSQLPGTPFGQGLTAPQAEVLKVVLGHVRRLWEATAFAVPTDEQLRGVLRALRVITVDADDGGRIVPSRSPCCRSRCQSKATRRLRGWCWSRKRIRSCGS